jgi:Xaa-Pro dipeptidase
VNELNERLTRLSEWLRQEDIAFAFITSTPNVFYLSGFHTNPHERLLALLVFQEEEPVLVCPNMEVQQVKQTGWSGAIIGYDDTENPWEFIHKHLQKQTITLHKIAIEKEHLNVERFEQLKQITGEALFVSAEDKLHQLRMIKDQQELKILKQAAELADFGVEVGINAIKEGATELEIIAAIEFELKKKGVKEMAFSTMVLTGNKTASPHGKPGLENIQKGDLVLFDLGVVLDGYCSDITRTVAFQSISNEQKDIYETVLKAQLAALDVCKPGEMIGNVDNAARKIISDAGYGEYFTHRVGHGLGIDVHEYPSMNGLNKSPLQPGMTFTVEPGIYIPEIGGVRIEDDVYITESGKEILTQFPKELLIIK